MLVKIHRSITVIISCQVGNYNWIVIHLSTCFGKYKAYFQIKFSRACGNHLLRMKCHMKAKTLVNYGYDFDLYQKITIKAHQCTQSCHMLVQMKI